MISSPQLSQIVPVPMSLFVSDLCNSLTGAAMSVAVVLVGVFRAVFMASFALCFCSVSGNKCATAQEVNSGGYGFKMAGAYAMPGMAQVVKELTFRNWAYISHVSQPMCLNFLLIPFRSAITASVKRVIPKPTTRRVFGEACVQILSGRQIGWHPNSVSPMVIH